MQFFKYFQNRILTQITSHQLECIRYILKEEMLYMDHKIGVGFFPDGSRVRLGGWWGKKSISGGRTACAKLEIY